MTTEEIESKEFPAVIPLIWVSVTAMLFWMLMPFLVGAFVDLLGYSQELAGRITAVQLLAMTATNAFAAFTVHRWNLARATLAGCILAVLSDFFAGFIQSAALMILTRIISGCAMGVIVSAAYTAISRLKNPTRILGIVQAGVSISSFVFYLVVPYLLKTTGLNGPFIGLAAFTLVAAVLTWVWFPRSEGEASVAVDQQGLWPILFAAPVLMALIGLFLGPQMAGSMMWPYLERIGVYVSLSAEKVGTTFALSAISGTLGGLAAAWMAGKISRSIAVTTSGLLMAASIALFLLYTIPTYFVAVQILMFTWFLMLAVVLGIFADADPSGRLIVVANVFVTGGGAAGPAVASLFLVGDNYNWVIIVACLLMLVAVVLLIPGARKQN